MTSVVFTSQSKENQLTQLDYLGARAQITT